MKDTKRKILVAVTGASGMLFLPPLIDLFGSCSDIQSIHGICSDAGKRVMSHEIGLEPNDLKGVERWFPVDDFSAAPASGSSGYTDMVVLPCTMGSLGAMATGACRNLIHRAADVMLKERRKLLLAVRETPLSRIHLSNMLTIHDAGAILMPTLPSYYLQPKSLEDAALTYCWRLADQLDIHIEERKRWGGDGGGAA